MKVVYPFIARWWGDWYVTFVFYWTFFDSLILSFELLIWLNENENNISLHIHSFSWLYWYKEYYLYWYIDTIHSLASNYLTKIFDVHMNHMHLIHICWWSDEKYLAMPHLLLWFGQQYIPLRITKQSLSGIKNKLSN